MRFNIATLEHIMPHSIHGGYPADDTKVTQGPQELPQYHAADRSLGDHALCCPLLRYGSGEPILANTNHRVQ